MIRRILTVLCLAYALGFALFMLRLAKPADAGKTDAVVVPTGGPGRIDRGLALLQAHRAKRMLVSGVAPGVRPIELAARYHVPARVFACCVDLGDEAVDTRSNGEETARWVHAHGYKSVRLVTSDWHMARARMELTSALAGEATIIEDGVVSHPRPQLLFLEYNKLILRRFVLWLGIDG